MKLCKDCKHCETHDYPDSGKTYYKCKTTAKANLVDGKSEWDEMEWCGVHRVGGRLASIVMGSCGEHARFWEAK
jgi:hypothetical protein